jgi:integrase
VPHKNPKYVHSFTDTRGKQRYYFRRGRQPQVALPAPWEEGFLEAYNAAATGKAVSKTRSPTTGTLGAVIVGYLGSHEFLGLRLSTQQSYRFMLDRLREDAGSDLVTDYETKHLEAMVAKRARQGGPEGANNLRRMLKKLFPLAVRMGLRKDNPAAALEKVKRPRGSKRSHRPWTEDDIAAFIAKYPFGTREYLALSLLLYTGQRRSDVVKLGPKNIRGAYDPKDFTGRKLALTQEKTGTTLVLPIYHALADALAEANIPADAPAFLLTLYGRPFTPQGFTSYFTQCSREAGIEEQASPHGLRHAAARRLAEAGCSEKLIASITGHETLKEVERYTKSANQEHMAEMAIAAISRPVGSDGRS